jgi:hypothetical protein
VLDLPQAQELQAVGLLPHALEPTLIGRFREIEEGAGDGGDWDLAPLGDFVRGQLALVQPNAGAAEVASRGGDMDGRGPAAGESPGHRGAEVAQDRAVAVGQHGGEPKPWPLDPFPPQGVDAAMEAVEPPASYPSLDLPLPKAEPEQLRAGHDPVLPFCQLQRRPILVWAPPVSRHIRGLSGGIPGLSPIARVGGDG